MGQRVMGWWRTTLANRQERGWKETPQAEGKADVKGESPEVGEACYVQEGEGRAEWLRFHQLSGQGSGRRGGEGSSVLQSF